LRINTNEDSGQVLVLANEVMDICRSSRTTFADVAETIVGPGAVIESELIICCLAWQGSFSSKTEVQTEFR